MGKNGALSENVSSYLAGVKETLGKLPVQDIEKVIYRLEEARKKGQRVFTCGNGGSATTSIALADILREGSAASEEPFIKARSLCESIGALTHHARKFSYEEVFIRAMRGQIEKGDVLIAISGSGRSQNVLNAVYAAKAAGATAIGFTGFDGGRLKDTADICVIVPSRSMEQIEDVHFLLGHLIATCLGRMPPQDTSLSAMVSSYLAEVSDILEKMPEDLIEKVVYRLEEARWKGQKILTCGNGGSAITSIHFAGDLMKGAMAPGKPIIEARSLCENIAHLTAYANDVSFEDAFLGVMDGQAKKGDVFIAMDEEGNSPNVLNAIDAARFMGATTIAFAGFDGGKLKDMADICVIVPCRSVRQIQAIHLLLCHLITNCLRNIPAEEVKF